MIHIFDDIMQFETHAIGPIRHGSKLIISKLIPILNIINPTCIMDHGPYIEQDQGSNINTDMESGHDLKYFQILFDTGQMEALHRSVQCWREG